LKGEEKYYSLYERERKKVEAKLLNAFKNRVPRSLYEPALYVLQSGGKRLRPVLVLFSSKAVGGSFERVYNASVAAELLHNFTLVHDDIMDNADKRRGRLTLHKKYDVNTAILAGDSLLSIAYEYLLKDLPVRNNGNSKAVLASFTKGLIEICEGQSLDKDFETRENVTIDDYIRMIKKKTAAMSEMCCSIGAQLGGGNVQEIKALSDFGRNIGIAFQIQDDLLDITADELKFGKFVGGDLVEGKKTFLFIKALAKAKGKDYKSLQDVVANKGIRPEQVQEYKELYKRLAVLDDAKNEIKKYSNNALRSLKILKNKEFRNIFTWLADSLVKRIS
jgi:geranylgeranyl diphosphate synthase type II